MRENLFRCAAFCLLTAACQDYAFEEVRPVTLVAATVEQKVLVTSKADILFVVDNSSSMAGEQDNLAANFSAFITALNAFDPPVDYQIGVTTTDVHKRIAIPGGCASDAECNNDAPRDCDAANVCAAPSYTCDLGSCLQTYASCGVLQSRNGRPAILKRPVVNGVAQVPQPADIVAAFADNVKVGTGGCFIEQGLAAMRCAIEKAVAGAGPNAGFLRDGSKLVVVIVSDEEDCSAPTSFVQGTLGATSFTDHCLTEARLSGGGALHDIESYVAFLRGLTNSDGSARAIQVGVVADVDDTSPGSTSPPRCVNTACFSACGGDANCQRNCRALGPGYRYDLFASAMGAGSVKASICSENFSSTLESLARIIGLSQEVRLPAEANNPELFKVTVYRGTTVIACKNGVDFEYIPGDPAILRFQGACTLQPDDRYDIRYLSQG